MKAGSRRAILMALGANLGIAIAKFAGFFVTRSASLLAEAVHSVADTGNQALLLWGAAAAEHEATADHPFGFGRERYFWAFVVAMILFSLGSLFAISHGIEKLGHAEPLNQPQWAIGILLLGIVLEGGSFWTAIQAARPLKGDNSWWRFVRNTKNPELPVVLLEDLGALVGLVIALMGISLSILSGDPRYDAGASILIGLLLGIIAIILAIEMKSLLIGESVSEQNLAAIREALQSGPDVRHVIYMRTQHLGPDQVLVAAKVEFSSTLSFEELTHAIDRAEARVRERLSKLTVVIYLEPDIFEPNSLSEG
ncbi:MAG: cation diffusion facilitator family transporter [Deltaproteobacteria bacterium]|nr:cation diffusion facilitator family transporter [Deltaproteobacteria bacterium]